MAIRIPKFIEDYLLYNSGNECPRNFHIWSALAVLSAVVGRKVFVNQGYFTIVPNLYVLLVADQGTRKSTAKDIARDLLMEVFPDMPVAASVATREQITKLLGGDESMRTYKNEKGDLVEYHPFVLFINELKNFLSVNPGGMIDFLTDIYDRDYFDVGTKNKGVDIIRNPCFTMLGCETPDWIVRKLKEDVISGGFSRRVLFVYEVEEPIRIPFPTITKESAEAWVRVKQHLKKISTVVGEFHWTAEARAFYEDWYINLKSPYDDRVMRGYFRSKHTQMLKTAQLLALCEVEPKLILTIDLLKLALTMLNAIEGNMPKLSAGAGRNELAVPTLRLLEFLDCKGGIVPEAELMKYAATDFQPRERVETFQYLQQTKQLFRETDSQNRVYYVNARRREDNDLARQKEKAQSAGLPPIQVPQDGPPPAQGTQTPPPS